MARLLVVEDYPPLATVIAIALRRAGHEVDRVGSVQRALSFGGEFDLAVLDAELPDGSGIELAGRLLDEGRAVRIVFFTANRDLELHLAAERYGQVVMKHGGLERLLGVIHKELELDCRLGTAKVVGAPDEALPGRETGRSGTQRRVR
jgi:DNA-binding response OmpR family regulator